MGVPLHGFDPTGGFLTWHNTWLTELLLRCNDTVLSRPLSALSAAFWKRMVSARQFSSYVPVFTQKVHSLIQCKQKPFIDFTAVDLIVELLSIIL